MNRRVAATVAFGLLGVLGWSLHWHVTVNNSSVLVKPPAAAQDGYMSVAQCASVHAGTPEYEVVAEYGMPKDDSSDNGSSDMTLAYPLTEDGSRYCTVTFGLDSHQASDVQLDLIDQRR